ncbi:MAG: hypothetical protein PHH06_03555 [Candidatus Gracilibacteria bacterium]|nr:hypothetical protein [Candidatus Gracilibacteria bacterium]
MSGIKIDLKALKNSYNPKGDNKNFTEKEIPTSQAITSEALEEETKDNKIEASIEKEVTIEKQEIKPELQESINEEKNEKSPLKSTKINLMGIKSLDNTSDLIKKVEASKSEEEKTENVKTNDKEANKEIFSQYKSDFVKNKETIIDGIKKLKNIPKTRIGLVVLLVLISSIGIGSLFIINPEIHSIENYKTSILEIFKEPKSDIEKPIKVEETPIKNEVIVIPSNVIKGGININYKSEIINGQETINYNGKIYYSKAEFETELPKIIEKLKIEKLTDYLRNK